MPVRLRGRLRKGSGDAVATVNKVTVDIYIYSYTCAWADEGFESRVEGFGL